MGTASGVAEYLRRELDQAERIDVNQSAGAADLARDPDELLIFCTSNTGAGDLPTNLQALYAELLNSPPNIAGRPYLLINLGDSSYPTFGQAGERLHAALQDIGASPIAAPFLVDTSIDRYPQKTVLEWTRAEVSLFLGESAQSGA